MPPADRAASDRALFEEWLGLRERVQVLERRIGEVLAAGEPSMTPQELYAAYILAQAGASEASGRENAGDRRPGRRDAPGTRGQGGGEDSGREREPASLGVTELSQHLGLSQSATSRMLARFEHQCGVITRTPSATDRRSLEVRLNREGHELLERTYGVVAQVLREAVGLGSSRD